MSDEQKVPLTTDSIEITLKSQDGDTVQFKIKPTTKIGKVFNAYAEKKQQDIKTLRFVTPDGNRIAPGAYETATAASMELEDGDSIDVFIEQVGGAGV